MRLLLLSTYELGHQPLHVASPAAALRVDGHEVRVRDLAVEPWDEGLVDWADAAAVSVPMHTAMRLGIVAAEKIRARRPNLPVAFYGLYAPVGRDRTVGRVAEVALAGEYEPALRRWAAALETTSNPAQAVAHSGAPAGEGVVVRLGRGRERFHLPARDLLPPLERYARYDHAGEQRLVGYVEATHGCKHTCRHCPVTAVYEGAFRVVEREQVLADIDQLVAAGARHITFGDPDFLNGPGHVLPLVRELHARHPTVSYDVTVKVEHLLRHADVLGDLAATGCSFIITAVESLDAATLEVLDKGHTPEEVRQALAAVRAAGIEPRPTFLPFTPWTTVEQLTDLLDFIVAEDLIANVDPVQYTIRLLIPDGSWLLERPELAPYLDGYDPDALTYRWHAADPRTDALQPELARLVEADTAAGAPPGATFLKVYRTVRDAAGLPTPRVDIEGLEARPRLTEPWFC